MTSSLGLCIEKNLIKYAKVTKNREEIKVETFGLKFYENIRETIKQIISETLSENVPISINLSDEIYQFFSIPSNLNKNEIKAKIDENFEKLCEKKDLVAKNYENRYSILEKEDTLEITQILANEEKIQSLINNMGRHKLSTIAPLGTSIKNIIEPNEKENILIVNMEDETIITSIVNKEINDIKTIKQGSADVLSKIANKENSYSKAYEICKNSTIYTIEGREAQDEGNEYMEYIIPTLYKIVTELQKYLAKSKTIYKKIYLTGTLSVVNNIDLYFQEFFQQEKCEILKPNFIKESNKINIKDYIEINSALSIAMQELGYGLKEMNFQKQVFSVPIPELLKKDLNKGKREDNSKPAQKENSKFSKLKLNLDFDMTGKLDKTEKWLLRGVGLLVALILVYSIFSLYLNGRINKKMQEVADSMNYTENQISLADEDIKMIDEKADEYERMINNFKNVNSKNDSDKEFRNAIPNLLVNIQAIIPENVQITSIENTDENDSKHIIIKAQSEYYDELGYFKVKLKEDGILSDVVSTQGNTEDGMVQMIIEGDLL